MPLIISEEEMDAMDSGNESDDEPMFMDMLEDIHDSIQYLPNVNRREACYKIHDRIKQSQVEWKGALKATQNTSKGSHKMFNTIVKEISQVLPPLGESGSEVSYFIPEPRNFAEVTKLSDNINKPWLKATQK